MGQVSTPQSPQSLILTALDRLVAANADGGLAVGASHVVLLGEDAGQNLGALSYIYVIGADSLKGGLGQVAQNGTVVYGALSLSALTNAVAPTVDGPLVVIGHNNFPQQVSRVGNSVIVGDNIGANMPAAGDCVYGAVLIGPDVVRYQRILAGNSGDVGFHDSVMIGARVLRGMSTFATNGSGAVAANNVLIGADIMRDAGFDGGIPGVTASANVIIGQGAAQGAAAGQNTSFQQNVIIGQGAVNGTTTLGSSVCIGVGVGNFGVGCSDLTLVGAGITGGLQANQNSNVALGSRCSLSGIGSRNVLLGPNCNATSELPNFANDRLLIQNGNGTLIYGNFAAAGPGPGGLILGNSSPANRDLPGFNIVKIINGSWDGVTAPVGGGFLYSAAGSLHWVDTAGNDKLLAGAAGEIAPPALAAGQTDDWAPAGIAAAVLVEVTVDAAGSQLSGMVGGFAGHQVTLFVSGGQLDLLDEDAASAAANRFHGVMGAGIIVADGQSVTLLYDSLIDRWRPIASF